jgi:hypothetical protein
MFFIPFDKSEVSKHKERVLLLKFVFVSNVSIFASQSSELTM